MKLVLTFMGHISARFAPEAFDASVRLLFSPLSLPCLAQRSQKFS